MSHEINIPKEAVMKKFCAWCNKLMRDGTEPETAGICTECLRKEFADIDIALKGKV